MEPYLKPTEDIQRDQALVQSAQWRQEFDELTQLKTELMSKLVPIATASALLHDALLDPFIIKGLCLALDHSYKAEDLEGLRHHSEALEQILISRKLTKRDISLVPAQEDREKGALQLQLIAMLLPIAQKTYTAWLFGKRSYFVNFFLCQAVNLIYANPTIKQLETLLIKARGVNLLCMELLEKSGLPC